MDRISIIHKVEHWLYNHHLNVIAQMLRGGIRIIFSADVPPQMRIGKGTVFPHDALGCVFHPDVRFFMASQWEGELGIKVCRLLEIM